LKLLLKSFLFNKLAESYTDFLRTNLTRLIAYAEGSNVYLQREVAEKLANEAVKPIRQVIIFYI